MDGLLGSGMWTVVIVLGPILLAVAIAWAMRHNRGTRRDVQRTEQATHELYDGDPVDRTKI